MLGHVILGYVLLYGSDDQLSFFLLFQCCRATNRSVWRLLLILAAQSPDVASYIARSALIQLLIDVVVEAFPSEGRLEIISIFDVGFYQIDSSLLTTIRNYCDPLICVPFLPAGLAWMAILAHAEMNCLPLSSQASGFQVCIESV